MGDDLISAGQGNDSLDGGGGNDSYSGFGGGRVTNGIDGGEGDDSFFVDDPAAYVIGGSGSDTVYTRADLRAVGVEYVFAQGGEDIVIVLGDATNAVVSATNGDNAIFASGGNDSILAQAGADHVDGGLDNDTLIGGWGADVLFGGGGADHFVLESRYDVTNTNASTNRIRDFVRGVDVIDLSAIGENEFTFLGTGAFTGSGAMEARYILSGGDALVVFDSDGNGFSDGRFWVQDQVEMLAGDFVL